MGDRLRRRVDPPHGQARGGRHLRPAQRREEAELLLRGLRPHGCGARRGPHLHLLRRREGRRAHQQLDGPERDEGHHARPLQGVHEGPDDVRHPLRHGSPQRREPDVRRRDHRLRVRRGVHARHGPLWRQRAAPHRGARRGRQLRPGPALHGRPARARPAGREVAVQRHEVHRAVPRRAHHLVLRLGLRRQRAPGQEVLLAAHRLRHGPRRGLARGAHAHPEADLPGPAGLLRRRRLPERLWQDQPGDAQADHPGLEGRDPG